VGGLQIVHSFALCVGGEGGCGGGSGQVLATRGGFPGEVDDKDSIWGLIVHFLSTQMEIPY
jgi:hypothetical protein